MSAERPMQLAAAVPLRDTGAEHAAPRARHLRVLAQPAYRNRDNPYTAMLYSHLAALGVEVDEFSWARVVGSRYDVWHLHWPETYPNRSSLVRACRQAAGLVALLSLARWRGTRIVWTVHNLSSHDEVHPSVYRWFWESFVRRLDAYIALSAGGAELARRRWPALARLPGFVIPHGHYRSCYANHVSRDEARRRLGLPSDATVLAFVGQIRRYKNLPALIGAFRELRGDPVRLLIAGQPNGEVLGDELRALAGGDGRIVLHAGFVADDELQLYLNASDLVVLPYREILNSGSAILALSFDRPVLVPRIGALAELQGEVGEAWVRTYDGELTAATLERALEWSRAPRSDHAPLDALEWRGLALATRAAFDGIVPDRSAASIAAAPHAAGPS